LPTGNLRESRRGAKRAHAIVVTKCPKNLSKEKQHDIKRKLKASSDQQVFFSTIDYHGKTGGKQQISLDTLNEYEIVLVTGIANPKPLLEFLNDKQYKIHHLNFPDHHNISSQEIKKIQAKFDGIPSSKKLLLTTEKDYMRLSDEISDLSYIEIESKFIAGKEAFDQILVEVANTKKV
jgi:tetraacyldisaccharide 4'-kinase